MNPFLEQYQALRPQISILFKELRARNFPGVLDVIEQLRDGPTLSLWWATYFTGILAEEKERNWAEAERHYLQLIAEDIEPILRAHVLLSLGLAYNNQARYQDSVQVCTESAAIWTRLNFPIKKAIVLRQLAISYGDGYKAGIYGQKELQQAIALCQDALESFRNFDPHSSELFLYEPDIPLYSAITLHALGNLFRAAGDWPQAIHTFEEFSRHCDKRNDRYYNAFAYWNLGDALQMSAQEKWDDVETLYHNAIAIFEEYQDAYLVFSVLASLSRLYQRMDRWADAVHCYQQTIERIESVRMGVTSEAGRIGFFAAVSNIFANAVHCHIHLADAVSAFDCAERSRSRALVDRLIGDEFARTSQSLQEPMGADAVRSYLCEDSVLLAYYATGHLNGGDGYTDNGRVNYDVLATTSHTLLFVLTAEGIEAHDLTLAPEQLIAGSMVNSVAERFTSPEIRRTLYKKLIAPATNHLQNKRRVYIIPHGPLHYIPFHALIAPDGDTLLRDDGPEIVYAPSATILFRELQAQTTPVSGSCLAVGYNGDNDMALNFAETEASYIAKMAGGDALIGPTPKKAALYAQASNYRALHFSCHGEFDPDEPLESLLHIGPGETLTGQEIMDHLQLNCNLVTLSACESGLSKVQRGDELYGLIRAFLYAGAPAILATLWRVDERATLIFAEKFYELLQQEVSYATALKTAQLYLKQLTRKEAVAILTRHLQRTERHLAAAWLARDKQAEHRQTAAEHPLKALRVPATDPTSAHLSHPNGLAEMHMPDADDDEPIFDDPRFWAPFILIGDPRLQRNF